MKKTRKILAVALFLLLMLTPVVSVSQPVTVQAAAKTTLKKSGGRYYAYENGKKLCNAWRTIKSGKVSYTYYFGANGAAYQADKGMMGKYSGNWNQSVSRPGCYGSRHRNSDRSQSR